MTLKEADEAAVRGLPVIYNGIEYRCICETGYRYEAGRRIGFVVLKDRRANSVNRADPKDIELIKEFEQFVSSYKNSAVSNELVETEESRT